MMQDLIPLVMLLPMHEKMLSHLLLLEIGMGMGKMVHQLIQLLNTHVNLLLVKLALAINPEKVMILQP